MGYHATQQKILILSPHTDDGEIAAGGTIARFIEEKKEVYYVSFSSCEISLPNDYPKDILKVECKMATETLGIQPDNLTLLDYEVRTFPKYRQEILDEIIIHDFRVFQFHYRIKLEQ